MLSSPQKKTWYLQSFVRTRTHTQNDLLSRLFWVPLAFFLIPCYKQKRILSSGFMRPLQRPVCCAFRVKAQLLLVVLSSLKKKLRCIFITGGGTIISRSSCWKDILPTQKPTRFCTHGCTHAHTQKRERPTVSFESLLQTHERTNTTAKEITRILHYLLCGGFTISCWNNSNIGWMDMWCFVWHTPTSIQCDVVPASLMSTLMEFSVCCDIVPVFCIVGTPS